MIETFTEFDPAEYLSTPEAIVEFMRDTQETGDTSYIDKAMEVVTRANFLQNGRVMEHLPSSRQIDG